MKLFGETVYEWMVIYKKNSVKPSTYDRLESSYKLMKKFTISCVPIDQIDTDYLQDYVNELVGSGYALSTIRKQYNLITAFMDYANTKGIIDRPFHKGVELPSRSAVQKPKREVISYTPLEQDKLKAVLYTLERPAYSAALLMLETGMRVGEVLALGWSDIDLRRGTVKIHKTFVRLGNHAKSYIQNEAKSYTSNRTVPLSSKALSLLKEMYLRDDFKEFVIHDKHGDPLGYESARWQIQMACRDAGVEYYGQHVFRHTFATNCYNKGCDVKLLSKFLGHADVTITYNIYIHLFGDAVEQMRLILD